MANFIHVTDNIRRESGIPMQYPIDVVVHEPRPASNYAAIPARGQQPGIIYQYEDPPTSPGISLIEIVNMLPSNLSRHPGSASHLITHVNSQEQLHNNHSYQHDNIEPIQQRNTYVETANSDFKTGYQSDNTFQNNHIGNFSSSNSVKRPIGGLRTLGNRSKVWASEKHTAQNNEALLYNILSYNNVLENDGGEIHLDESDSGYRGSFEGGAKNQSTVVDIKTLDRKLKKNQTLDKKKENPEKKGDKKKEKSNKKSEKKKSNMGKSKKNKKDKNDKGVPNDGYEAEGPEINMADPVAPGSYDPNVGDPGFVPGIPGPVGSVRNIDPTSMRLRQRKSRPALPQMEVRTNPATTNAATMTFLKDAYDKLYRDQLKSATIEEHSGYEKWKIERAKRLKKVKMKMREISEYFTVFRGSFKTIEGSFGSSVLAYFRFVKWLLFLNLFTTLVILGCIVFPQEFMSPSTFNETIWTSNYSLANPWVEEAYHCSKNYTDRLSSANSDTSQLIIDFFQGSGWMENTVLFTGYYFNKTYMFGDNTTHYNMPLAYLLTTAVYFGITLILMVQYTGKGVKDKMVNSGEKFYSNCNKVFCGWDYSLSTQKACTQKHKNIFMEFKNDLEELKRQQRRDNMSGCAKFRVFMIRVIVWTLVLAISGAAFYVIVLVVSAWQPELLKMDSVKNSSILQLIVEFLPSLTITALNALIPPIFYKLVIVEDYNPDNEIKISIARTVFLKLASVGVLVFTLHSQITSCADSESVCGNCPGVSAGCWESYVGQEFYKLVVLDFLVICLITFAVEFPRRIIVKRFQHKKLFQIVGLQEFEIPKNVLDIVYSQTICWFGGFFSPLIPAITVVKFFIFFYVKKLSLIQNCIPHKKPYKASRSSYFFMVVLLLSFGLCVLAIAIWVGRIPPSQTCGPFRVYTTDDFYMYTVVSNGVAQLHTIPRDIIYFLSNWLVYILVLIVVCLLIYYYHAVSNGNKKLVQLLKDQMALEGKDKQFLLARVNDALLRGDFTANNN